jgi:hypothetical protein
VFLDYLDSGHSPASDGTWPAGTFCAAPVSEAAATLAALLAEENASLLIADDRNGGYGHPDHQHVHRVAWAAAQLAHVPLLQATIDREFLSGGIELAKGMGFEVPEGFVPADLSTWYTPNAEITHTVDVSSVLDTRKASMNAHATQATGAPDTVRTENGYLVLARTWQDGDTLDLTLPMAVRVRPAMDDTKLVSFFYGPVLLAGALGKADMPLTDIVNSQTEFHKLPPSPVPDLDSIAPASLIPVTGQPLTFIAKSGADAVQFIPFYELHHQRYSLYWRAR